MRITYIVLNSIFIFANLICQAQTTLKMENNNILICNPDSGICEIPTQKPSLNEISLEISNQKPIKIIYYTDPICSSCWGIEPQLRKLKLEYGSNFEIEYRMGGLLPDWSYNSGGISKPSDVAHHWDEVSVHYDMPIDGDVWLTDPLASSYPPSIACKAAQMQNKEKAILFLREIREMVFLQKKNICKWEHLEFAAQKVGLDLKRFKNDYENKAKILFEEDLKLARELGVRGFPTMFFTDQSGNNISVYGSKPYATFENALLKQLPSATKTTYDKNWATVFSKYQSLTAKEFSELTGMPRLESEKYLDNLSSQDKLKKYTTKNGGIWTINQKAK